MNELLEAYESGYELSATGEVLALGDPGLAPLHAAPLPTPDTDNVGARVAAAQAKFRWHRSTQSERRDAIRDLADVLEFLRPQLAGILNKKDDAALFEIANRFAIRHHNPDQQGSYDKLIWYSWIFYFYLANIHAVGALLRRAKANDDHGGTCGDPHISSFDLSVSRDLWLGLSVSRDLWLGLVTAIIAAFLTAPRAGNISLTAPARSCYVPKTQPTERSK